MTDSCVHLDGIQSIAHPRVHECEACVAIGASWVHLRTCQQCGVTRCCDSSPNKHSRHHFQDTGHPVIASAEPGERWVYCYADDAIKPY